MVSDMLKQKLYQLGAPAPYWISQKTHISPSDQQAYYYLQASQDFTNDRNKTYRKLGFSHLYV